MCVVGRLPSLIRHNTDQARAVKRAMLAVTGRTDCYFCGLSDRHLSQRLVAFLCFALTVAGAGCGGGTTGTSPTDGLKFSGYAQAADGSRAPELTMTVRSATTDEPLVDSGTDENGDFLMSLPSSEETLVVDVAGFNSTTVARTQRGGGSLTAKLAVAASGDMRAEQVSEAQIESFSLCSGLTVSGNEVVINGPLPQEACVLTLIVASQQLELETFVGSLRGNCAGAAKVVQSARADREGRVQLDLNRALSAECSDIRIEVSSSATQGLQHIFVVE